MVFVLRCWAMKYVVKSNFYWSEFKSSHSLIYFPHFSFLSHHFVFRCVWVKECFPVSEMQYSLTFFLRSLYAWLRNLISYLLRKEMVGFVRVSRVKKILFNACNYKLRKTFLHVIWEKKWFASCLSVKWRIFFYACHYKLRKAPYLSGHQRK